jgi:hypothetical protein
MVLILLNDLLFMHFVVHLIFWFVWTNENHGNWYSMNKKEFTVIWHCHSVYYMTLSFCILYDIVILYIIWHCHSVYYMTLSFCILYDIVILYIIWHCHSVYYMTLLFCILYDIVILYIIYVNKFQGREYIAVPGADCWATTGWTETV